MAAKWRQLAAVDTNKNTTMTTTRRYLHVEEKKQRRPMDLLSVGQVHAHFQVKFVRNSIDIAVHLRMCMRSSCFET